jgi:hypothetical protein
VEHREETLLEEIGRRLGPGQYRPFVDVDVLFGYLYRPEEGRWRLYRSLDSADYLEGSDKDLGAMRDFLTPTGDTMLWVRDGAELVRFKGGVEGAVYLRAESTSWHTRSPTCRPDRWSENY